MQNGSFSEEGSEEVSNGSFSQEGAEVIVNGDFSNGNANWTIYGSATAEISNGKLNLSNAATYGTSINNSAAVVSGKTYLVEYTISDYVGGSSQIRLGSQFGTSRNSNGTFSEYIVANDTLIRLYPSSSNTTLSIDNVSVREVGQDWELQNGWSIGNNVAVFSGTSSAYRKLYQENILTIGKSYKLTFDIVSINSGSIKNFSQSNPTSYSTIGTKTEYFTATFDDLFLEPTTDADCSITNISVKEVGQNWDFGTGWSIGEDKAIGTSATGVLYTNITITSSNKARIKADVDISGGGIQLRVGGVSLGYFYDNIDYVFTSNGNGLVEFVGQSFTGSITNISVIEITDDTNLPRINYEGFSYQDALGSEEVVNGTFDSDTAWTLSNSTISNGELNILTASINNTAIQSISNLVVGSDYKIEYKINSISSGGLVAYEASHTRPAYQTSTGVYSNIFTATATTQTIYIRTSGATTASIDNVSVKEYLGQSVVPESGCGSWLFEPQSTNLFTQSELFTDSSWAKTQTTIEAASITLPNGLTNGYKLFANTTGGTNHWLEKSPFPTATTGQDYTLSLFVKSAGSDFIQIASSSGFPSRYQNFNISTGTKASGDISDSSITDFGNGWYRISVTETTTATTARYLIVPILSDGGRNPQFAGNADEDGVYIWAAMLEQNSFSTSYIPTEGSTVTRNQDVCNNGATGTGLINSTEGVLYWEGAKLQAASGTQVLGLSDGSGANRIGFQTSTTANQIRFVVDAGGNQASLFFVLDDITDYNKLALKWKQDDFSFWVNGIKVGTDTSGNVPPLNALDTLDFYYGTGIFNFTAKTKALAVWKEALSDQELTELTTI